MDRCRTGLRDGGAKPFASVCSGKQVVGDLWQNVFKGRIHFPSGSPTPDVLNRGISQFVPFTFCPAQHSA